jgi:hypothetical protein
MGLSYTSVTTLAVRDINPADGGPAAGFIETSGQVGASAGTAIATAILLVRLAAVEKHDATTFSAQLPASARGAFVARISHLASSPLNVSHPASSLTAKVAHVQVEVFQHAYVSSMRTTLIGPLVVAVLFMLLALAIKSPRYHRARTISESGVFNFPRA